MQSNPKSSSGDANQELFNTLALQFCNNLKYVGVLKQISNEHLDCGFSVSSMHFYSPEIGHLSQGGEGVGKGT